MKGLNDTEAYAAAYPRASRSAAMSNAGRLIRKDEIRAEIARIRAAADKRAGSAALTLAEKRMFAARLVRVNLNEFDPAQDGDLLQEVTPTEFGRKFKLGDKLAAIKLDNDLAGEGSEAEANDGLRDMFARLCGK